MKKKGVLLINVGTPDEPTVKSIRNYLREFLLDPDVIDAPYIIRQLLVRGIILRVRPRKITPLYQKIWMDDGSPLRVYSDRITKSLNLKSEGYTDPNDLTVGVDPVHIDDVSALHMMIPLWDELFPMAHDATVA